MNSSLTMLGIWYLWAMWMSSWQLGIHRANSSGNLDLGFQDPQVCRAPRNGQSPSRTIPSAYRQLLCTSITMFQKKPDRSWWWALGLSTISWFWKLKTGTELQAPDTCTLTFMPINSLEWVNKTWTIHIMWHYSAIKKMNELCCELKYNTTEPKQIILSDNQQ